MTDDRSPQDPERSEPTDFDWTSPRWREAEAESNEDARGRRFRSDPAPRQRGAIDAAGSVPSHPPETEPEQDPASD